MYSDSLAKIEKYIIKTNPTANQLKYLKHYKNLILQNKCSDDKVEYHHIVPKCFQGKDDETNLIPLSLEKHYIAHALLSKMFPNKSSLSNALAFMSRVELPGRKISNKVYGWVRKRTTRIAKENYKSLPLLVCPHCSKTGKTKSFIIAHFDNCSKINPEAAEKRKHKIVTCPHCGTSGGEFGIKVYHFDNCKLVNPDLPQHNVEYKKYEQETLTCPHCGKTGGHINMKIHHFDNCPTINPEKQKAKKEKMPTLTCPHCGKTGKSCAMYKYHFDNCPKINPDAIKIRKQDHSIAQAQTSCIYCHKTGGLRSMKQNHFDNCKFKADEFKPV